MNIQLTDHAEKRLIERTGISISTFKGMYKEGKYLSTGKEEKSRRIHDLFYCIDDKTFFVSIRDEKNNEVVTILPLDYHENLAWASFTDIEINIGKKDNRKRKVFPRKLIIGF